MTSCRYSEAEIILLCVRWYLRFSLSFGDPEELMAERDLRVLRCRPLRYRSVMLQKFCKMDAA